MHDANTNHDPQKKYWWIIKIVVPISVALIVALIALIPYFLNKKETKPSAATTIPGTTQKAENVEQSTNKGHNISNVQGNVTITESNDEAKK
jgi:flagellar basal body-associated protein FliL